MIQICDVTTIYDNFIYYFFLRFAAYGCCIGSQRFIADSWNPGIRRYSVAGTASASLSLLQYLKFACIEV